MPARSRIDFATRQRSTIAVAVGIVIVVVLVFLGIRIYDANQDDPTPDKGAAGISLPTSFGAFTRATDAAAAALTNQLRTTEKAGRTNYRHKFAVYRNTDGQRILVSALSARDSAAGRDFLHNGPTSDVLDDVLLDSKVIAGKDYTPNPFGGAFRCGVGVYATNASTAVCGWADRDTAGTLIDVSAAGSSKPITPATLAVATRQLRNAAEKG